MAENCNFGDQKERMIRDRIVIGVKEQRIQQKLLEVKDLTMAKAVDICRSAELPRKNLKVLTSPEVHAVQVGKSTQQQSYKSNKNYYKCKKCNTVHGPRQCPAFGVGEFKSPLQLRIQPGVEPVVRPPRRVPNALMKRLADKLEALVKHKVLAEVEHPKNFSKEVKEEIIIAQNGAGNEASATTKHTENIFRIVL
ncbi:unnamed protein product, partial [Brenthis ino]